jgi:hypothetical protein
MLMKLISFGIILLVMTFCGLQEKLKEAANTGSNTAPSNSSNSASTSKAEKAVLSPSQQAIADSATETKWDDQGVSWRLPAGWKKMDVKKESFNYQSPDNAFLLVNISLMPDSFPMDTSLQAYYEQALQQLKNGKYESAKMVEIDGIPGVEFTEAPPEEKDGIRRHQWIGYRTYLGQKQQLNVMTSTRGNNFAKHADEFQAILYSMNVVK